MNSNTPQYDADQLRARWSEARAHRVGMVIARLGVPVAIAAFFLDYHYSTWYAAVANLILLAGAVLSLRLSRGTPSRLAWLPLYIGFVIAVYPDIWVTGGVDSPWFGVFLAVMAIVGTVVQPRLHVAYNLLFVVANLVIWYAIDHFVGIAPIVERPQPQIVAITTLCLLAIGLCIYELMRTERDLSTQFMRQYAELFDTRATLTREESANQAKSAFLANVSHELRTPLGAIMGYANLIQDPNATAEEKAQFAKTIERNGEQLARLVDDLLDLSKVEAGRIEVETIESRPNDLIAEVMELLRVNADRRGVALNVRYVTPIPERTKLDPVRFKQILMNVVGNALKFTSEGSVSVTIRHAPRLLVISVRDTGRGISPEERSKLFKPFSQADASTSRQYGGTGLGLSLSRKLARLLGGDLELSWSQLGFGSEFTFHIPIEVEPGTGMQESYRGIQPVSKAPQSSVDLRGMCILIVDDSADNRDIVQRYLQSSGAQVEEAEDGVECLQKVGRRDYDLILMDIQMPGLDGLQATSILRQRCYRKPIVALTAHAMKQDRQRCLDAGCDGHIAKPIQKSELLETVARFRPKPTTDPARRSASRASSLDLP